MNSYQICTRCVMDTTDPDIIFDEHGHCNHCTNAIERLKQAPYGLSSQEKEKALSRLIKNIKRSGEGKKYDCIIGLSGGVDSSYVAYLVKQWGLKPLAVHIDNGWNSEEGVENIKNICQILSIDLINRVLDWEEFKDLQLAFLKASTPDSEIPTDNILIKILFQIADKHKLKYILSGVNKASESILPLAWSIGHKDKKYIKSVYKHFGTKKHLSLPLLSIYQMKYYYGLLKHITWVETLDYVEYDKEKAKKILRDQLNWQDYGRKHGESIYTKIYQEYILPQKFGYDKRRAHFSSTIVSNQLNREKALELLEEPLYANEEDLNKDILFFCDKFGITLSDFDKIMSAPKKTIRDYPNTIYSFAFRLRRTLRKYLFDR